MPFLNFEWGTLRGGFWMGGFYLTDDAWVSGPDFGSNRELQQTWLVTLSAPLVAILNFTQKCKQTVVSQKLSKIKNFFQDIFCISWGT